MVIKFLIIEDHPIVAEGLHKLLLESFINSECFIAGNGKKALAILNGHPIDIVILDINLPDCNGSDLCTTIKMKFTSIKIITLSSYGQRSYVEKMINAGSLAYLHKNAEPEEIIAAINATIKGDTYYSCFIKDVMNNKSDSKNHSLLPLLTGRETQILILVAEGLTNQEIADKLFISQQTAISHRKNLLIKFNARNTAELVRLALQSGLIG